MKWKSFFIVILAAAASSLAAWSGDGEYPFAKMDDKLVTPHFDFAKKHKEEKKDGKNSTRRP